MNKLFITGCFRSGTTLLDKILHAHSEMNIGSQPLPYLYFNVKNKFNQYNNIEQIYPFDHMFLNNYRADDLTKFIYTCRFSKTEIDEILSAMFHYDGQHMHDFLKFCLNNGVPSGFFRDIYDEFMALMLDYFGKNNCRYIGSKEIILEEFIPFFLETGHKILVILRDPRDVLTSAYCGKGNEYIGNIRPTLYSLRMWRKSVAYCLEFNKHSGFLFIKYEDLVSSMWDVLDKITNFLGISQYPRDSFSGGIYQQDGNLWKGNSSIHNYTDVSTSSVGHFKEYLDDNIIKFVEAICGPEMEYLGYERFFPNHDKKIIKSYIEPITINHPKFYKNYSHSPINIKQETMRLELLKEHEIDDIEQSKWFIFPSVYKILYRIANGKI